MLWTLPYPTLPCIHMCVCLLVYDQSMVVGERHACECGLKCGPRRSKLCGCACIEVHADRGRRGERPGVCGCVQVPAEELEALRTGAVERLTLLNRGHTYGYRCVRCPT